MTVLAICFVKWIVLACHQIAQTFLRRSDFFDSLHSMSSSCCQSFSRSVAVSGQFGPETARAARIIHFGWEPVGLGLGFDVAGRGCSTSATYSGRSCRTRPGWWPDWLGAERWRHHYWASLRFHSPLDHLWFQIDVHFSRAEPLLGLKKLLALSDLSFPDRLIRWHFFFELLAATPYNQDLQGSLTAAQLERISSCSSCFGTAWSPFSIELPWAQLLLYSEAALLNERQVRICCHQ